MLKYRKHLKLTEAYVFSALLYINFISSARSLECYVCTRQEGNVEKCLSTVKTCKQDEDVCQSELLWGSTPYWNQVAAKQYYVTKRCAKKHDCERKRQEFMGECHRIWYEDWKCAECCQGDRCNYYIMMKGNQVQISIGLVIGSIFIAKLF